MKRIICSNATNHQNKYYMPLTFTLLVARSTFVLVLILIKGWADWWTSVQISAHCFVVGLPNQS